MWLKLKPVGTTLCLNGRWNSEGYCCMLFTHLWPVLWRVTRELKICSCLNLIELGERALDVCLIELCGHCVRSVYNYKWPLPVVYKRLHTCGERLRGSDVLFVAIRVVLFASWVKFSLGIFKTYFKLIFLWCSWSLWGRLSWGLATVSLQGISVQSWWHCHVIVLLCRLSLLPNCKL